MKGVAFQVNSEIWTISKDKVKIRYLIISYKINFRKYKKQNKNF